MIVEMNRAERQGDMTVTTRREDEYEFEKNHEFIYLGVFNVKVKTRFLKLQKQHTLVIKNTAFITFLSTVETSFLR